MADTFLLTQSGPGKKVAIGLTDTGETQRGETIYALRTEGGAPLPYVVVSPDGADYDSIDDALIAGHRTIALKGSDSYSGAVSITQDDVTILCNGANWTERTAGHTFTISGNNVTIKDLKSSGSHDGTAGSMTAYSVYNVTGNNCQIINPTFENLQGYGATFTGVNSGYVYDVNAVNVATDAADNFRIRYLIYVNGDSENVQVVGGNITGNSQGVGFWRGSNCKVAFVRGIDNYGYEDDAGTPYARSFIEDYGAATGQRNNHVVHCVIDGSTSHGIECAQGVIGSTYAHNTVRNCMGKSISITGQGTQYTQDIYVFDNNFYDKACSVVEATNVRFDKNRFYSITEDNALYFEGDSVGGKATGNTFRNCAGTLIRFDANNGYAADNDIVSSAANCFGIRVGGGTTGHEFADNHITMTGSNAAAMLVIDSCAVHGGKLSSSNGHTLRILGSNVLINAVLEIVNTAAGPSAIHLDDTVSNVRIMNCPRIYKDESGPVIDIGGATRLFIEHNTIQHADNDTIVRLKATTTKCVVDKNYHIRPDGANGIVDSGTANVTGTVYLP